MTKTPKDLLASTRQVFDECAAVYLQVDKHWGDDIDMVAEYLERFSTPEIIEFGTGHAWHLANVRLRNPKIKRALGIDSSSKMLAQARKTLEKHGMLKKVELLHLDIFDMGLKNGSFDVGLLLNNTLGNLPGKTFDDAMNQRKRALDAVSRVLRPRGYLIVSVFNARMLNEEDKYGEALELDKAKSSVKTKDLVIRFKKTNTAYYSHWFTEEEVRDLLYEAGFTTHRVEERLKRIVIVGQKAP